MSAHPHRSSLEGLEIEIFKLVSKDATLEQWVEWLRAPLEHAAAQGNQGLVDKLLGAGADGSAGWKGCGGRTLLYAAVVGGSEGVVSSLLRAGAQPDVNVLSAPSSRSPLYQATLGGHEAVARLLVVAGADVNFTVPRDKLTVLHLAIQGGYEKLAKELLLSGADVDARDPVGCTPLHMAASKGLNRTVSVLLLKRADKDAVDSDGDSALMYASGALGPHLAVVETLLAAGADLNIRRPSDDYSALDWASCAGHVPTIQAILRHGADVNCCSGANGKSALHRAVLNDQADSVHALIEAGADMEKKLNTGITPMCLAARCGKSKALLALLLKGATVGAPDNTEGLTSLHVACLFQRDGLAVVVDLLLRWGADEDALDSNGRTPAEALDRVPNNRTCSQEVIDRARLLLARAPADRAWRRRSWLVMLRARASRARIASCVESSGAAASGACEGRKAARREGTACVADEERGQAVSRFDDVGAESGDDGSGALRGAVGWLVGMEPEGVFRMVLEFL